MYRFDRTESQPKPVRTVSQSDNRPVRIERSSKGVLFFDTVTGNQISRQDAVTLMRAFKRGEVGSVSHRPKARRKPVSHVAYTVTLYATDLRSKASKPIASAKAETFLALSTKLASLCMKHPSTSQYAVEVQIEQEAK